MIAERKTPDLPIAVDAMGGDHAPGEIVSGACRAADELGVDVMLVGDPAEIRGHLPGGEMPSRVQILAASETIGMHDEPAAAVRSRRDSSIVRAAEAVKAGDAAAMVGAGNTGATMAAALLRFGRIRHVSRPAIGIPIPRPGAAPLILVDGGATVDCQPDWIYQFALMGREYSRLRAGIDRPRVALLSNGEEPGKGDELRKQSARLLAGLDGFVGNCEGRDLLGRDVDVVVTDGFTGNVALKAIEGALRVFSALVLEVLDSTDETRRAAEVLLPPLLDAAAVFDPDATGGAALLGVDGVCVISHGSSSATAVVNAVRVAAEAVANRTVERLAEAVSDAG